MGELPRQSYLVAVWLERIQFALAGGAGVEAEEGRWTDAGFLFALSVVTIIVRLIVYG